jgi:hypothetical protein
MIRRLFARYAGRFVAMKLSTCSAPECREPVTSETRPDVKAHRVCVAVPSRCGERTVGDARGEDDVDPVRQPTADGHALIEHERSVNETLLLYA